MYQHNTIQGRGCCVRCMCCVCVLESKEKRWKREREPKNSALYGKQKRRRRRRRRSGSRRRRERRNRKRKRRSRHESRHQLYGLCKVNKILRVWCGMVWYIFPKVISMSQSCDDRIMIRSNLVCVCVCV